MINLVIKVCTEINWNTEVATLAFLLHYDYVFVLVKLNRTKATFIKKDPSTDAFLRILGIFL